ncbi:hypothetical protein C8F01DRAFT_655687 [Mycena amicta]|nr:hypothetical protein C8F01DRAFT_655687 [Mycena amicta]
MAKSNMVHASIIYNERGRRVEEDEPDMFSEDDMTVASARSERVRSPPPLSRPPSSAAIRAPVPPTPRADTPAPPATERDSIPEVARLPDEEQPSRGGSGSGSERGSTEREPSRGRKSEKGKGKDKDKKDKQQTPEERMTSRSSSKLADELSSVWGNEASGSATRSPPTQSRGVEAPETVVEEASDSREEQHAEPSSSATPKTDSPKKPDFDYPGH